MTDVMSVRKLDGRNELLPQLASTFLPERPTLIVESMTQITTNTVLQDEMPPVGSSLDELAESGVDVRIATQLFQGLHAPHGLIHTVTQVRVHQTHTHTHAQRHNHRQTDKRQKHSQVSNQVDQ
jgi:hypothetical protein